MLKGQKKHIDKEHGKTKHEAPRSVNIGTSLSTALFLQGCNCLLENTNTDSNKEAAMHKRIQQFGLSELLVKPDNVSKYSKKDIGLLFLTKAIYYLGRALKSD